MTSVYVILGILYELCIRVVGRPAFLLKNELTFMILAMSFFLLCCECFLGNLEGRLRRFVALAEEFIVTGCGL